MRARMTAVLGMLLCVLALSAVASASASAACKHPGLCIEGASIGTEGKHVTTEVVVHGVAGSPAVINIAHTLTITCEKMATSGRPITIQSGAFAELENMELKLENCVATPAGFSCQVNVIGIKPLASNFTGAKGENMKFERNPFMAFNVENGPEGCILNGSYTTKGSLECTLKGAETEAASKEFTCNAKQSHLITDAGMSEVQFTSLAVQLELAGSLKGKKFSL
jgi:hypothetical protein